MGRPRQQSQPNDHSGTSRFSRSKSRFVGILMNKDDIIENKERELILCYSMLQTQSLQIDELVKQVQHLEQLLKHKAHLLDKED